MSFNTRPHQLFQHVLRMCVVAEKMDTSVVLCFSCRTPFRPCTRESRYTIGIDVVLAIADWPFRRPSKDDKIILSFGMPLGVAKPKV